MLKYLLRRFDMSINDEIKAELDSIQKAIKRIDDKLSGANKVKTKAERIMPSFDVKEAYAIEISRNGTVRVPLLDPSFDKVSPSNTNCFMSECFAGDIASKIDHILEVATLKEWLCPEYDVEAGWTVKIDKRTGRYLVVFCGVTAHENIDIFFDRGSAANACAILNKRHYDGD